MALLGLLAWSILQQCTAAAALTQADDAAVLLQFQQQYGFAAEDWVGIQPCGASAGEMCLHSCHCCLSSCSSASTAAEAAQLKHMSILSPLQAGNGAM